MCFLRFSSEIYVEMSSCLQRIKENPSERFFSFHHVLQKHRLPGGIAESNPRLTSRKISEKKSEKKISEKNSEKNS